MQTQPQPQSAQSPATVPSGPARRVRAEAAHVQMPRELLHSPDHGALAVVLWAHYEDLMAPGLGGTRTPARARRRTVGDAYGISTSAVDAARRELLAETPGGPWLTRSAPRGAKRSVKHLAMRRPRQTGGRYVRIPQWTRDLVWAGRKRPAGRISPVAWRLYGRLVERVGHEGGTLERSARELGALLAASADTGRRRLLELEAAGLCAVTERPGDRLSVRVNVRQEEAEAAADRYAEHGRERQEPRQDPPRIVALPPSRDEQAPPAGNGTPWEPPALDSSFGDAARGPACDHVQVVSGRAGAADAGRQDSRKKTGPTPRQRRRGVAPERVAEAAAVYRTLPEALRRRIPEHGSRRVLRAIVGELEHRQVAELRARVLRRWEHFRYRPETIQDPTAVAITVVRRAYDQCPHVTCEDGTRMDTGAPCEHCNTRPAPSTSSTPATDDDDHQAAADEGQAPAAEEATRPVPLPVDEARAAARPDGIAAPGIATERGATLARRLLAARSAEERAEIMADEEGAADDR